MYGRRDPFLLLVPVARSSQGVAVVLTESKPQRDKNQMFQALHIELGQCRLHTAQPYLLALTWAPGGPSLSRRDAPEVP